MQNRRRAAVMVKPFDLLPAHVVATADACTERAVQPFGARTSSAESLARTVSVDRRLNSGRTQGTVGPVVRADRSHSGRVHTSEALRRGDEGMAPGPGQCVSATPE